MGDEHDNWLKSALGLDVGSIRGEAAGASAGDAEGGGSDDTSLIPPVISVKSDGAGTCTVTGSKFLPTADVHVRIVLEVNGALAEGFFQTKSDGQGKISLAVPTDSFCQQGGVLHFSANDGRPNPNDKLGTLISNTVTVACGTPAPPDDPDDPPDDPPDPPDPPAPSDPPAPADPPASGGDGPDPAPGGSDPDDNN